MDLSDLFDPKWQPVPFFLRGLANGDWIVWNVERNVIEHGNVVRQWVGCASRSQDRARVVARNLNDAVREGRIP